MRRGQKSLKKIWPEPPVLRRDRNHEPSLSHARGGPRYGPDRAGVHGFIRRTYGATISTSGMSAREPARSLKNRRSR